MRVLQEIMEQGIIDSTNLNFLKVDLQMISSIENNDKTNK